MRKFLLLLLALLLPCLACAEVPDDVLHSAIATLFSEPSEGECWVEGHIVLDTEETETEAIVYAQVKAMDFGFRAGIFTDIGSGFVIPMRFTFDRTAEGLVLRDIAQPEDGTEYTPSLKEILSGRAYKKLQNLSDADMEEITRQMYEQAQVYLDSIGRSEPVGNWRDLDLQLADMLVPASNHIICFSSPYPLWVTSQERIENGERFVYTRAWEKDADSPGGFEYAIPDGGTLLCSGNTGVCTLTKTRAADGAMIETIVIDVDVYEMTVTFLDDFGEKRFRFSFDGETYHQPTVTTSGNCRVDYPGFTRANERLPI